MPPWRICEANERRLDDLARAMRAEEAMNQKELPAPALRLAHRPHFASPVPLKETQPLERADGRMHRRVGGPIRPPAIPATVGHLLLQQVASKGVETGVFIREVREDGKDHPRDARLAPTGPFCPDAVVDAAVALQPAIEKERAGLSRLPVAAWQTEVAEQEHGVGSRGPLG